MKNTVRHGVSRALVLLALASTAFLAASDGFAAPLASESCNDKDNPPAFCKAVPGDRAEGCLPQGRSEVMARNGMVTTSNRWRQRPDLRFCAKAATRWMPPSQPPRC
jgi:hypothetical protein